MAKTRKRIAKRESLPAHKKRAWNAFSKYIRARDGKCFTCGATENLQAGHFIRASQCYNYFNFDERNVNAQCKKCNLFLDGNYIEYTVKMQELYGIDIVAKLKEDNQSFAGIKPTREGYDHYREKYEKMVA